LEYFPFLSESDSTLLGQYAGTIEKYLTYF
jgi:hypothetical protein